jgi:hypothetical protein
MGVVRAEIQTVEDIYQLVWTAIASKRPIEAIYDKRFRLFCPVHGELSNWPKSGDSLYTGFQPRAYDCEPINNVTAA